MPLDLSIQKLMRRPFQVVQSGGGSVGTCVVMKQQTMGAIVWMVCAPVGLL